MGVNAAIQAAGSEARSLEQQQAADEYEIEGDRLYRTLKAALRRAPTPRELHRARAVFFENQGVGR